MSLRYVWADLTLLTILLQIKESWYLGLSKMFHTT